MNICYNLIDFEIGGHMAKKKSSSSFSITKLTIAFIFFPFLILFGVIFIIVQIIKLITNNLGKKSYSYATLDTIDRMTGIQFEEYVSYCLLPKLGYTNIIKTKNSSDYGVDVIASYQGTKIAIQCKRYQNKVGIEAVQEVIGGLNYYKCSIGVVITNNYFTPNAIKLAECNGIKLVDRNELFNLINSIVKTENNKVNNQRKLNFKKQDRKIISYNSQTGVPIYFDQCRLVGYNPENGNAIYENLSEIIKYDTMTGVPIYKRIEISKDIQNNN